MVRMSLPQALQIACQCWKNKRPAGIYGGRFNLSLMSLERAIRVAQREQFGTSLAEKAVVLPRTPGEKMRQRDLNCIRVAHGLDRSRYKPDMSFIIATSSSVICNYVLSKIMKDRVLCQFAVQECGKMYFTGLIYEKNNLISKCLHELC